MRSKKNAWLCGLLTAGMILSGCAGKQTVKEDQTGVTSESKTGNTAEAEKSNEGAEALEEGSEAAKGIRGNGPAVTDRTVGEGDVKETPDDKPSQNSGKEDTTESSSGSNSSSGNSGSGNSGFGSGSSGNSGSGSGTESGSSGNSGSGNSGSGSGNSGNSGLGSNTESGSSGNSGSGNSGSSSGTESGNSGNSGSGNSGSGNSGSSGSGTTTAQDGLVLVLEDGNSWGENPKYTQLNARLTNETDTGVNGWTLRIKVGSGVTIDQGWSGTYTVEGDTLVVTNVDYNAQIAPHQTVDFGVILAGISGNLSYEAAIGSTYVPDQNNNNNNNNNNNGNKTGDPSTWTNDGMVPVPEKTTNDWLHVEGNKICDASGKQVWLTGCNWFGYNTGTNTFDGLWAADLNTSLKGIADHGFNLLRLPISAELVLQWKSGNAPQANFNNATNYYLVGLDSLQIFDYVIGQCRGNGLKIMIDIHCAKTDSMGHMANMWYNGNITTEKYQEALCWLAERYADDDTIIAYDLKNEPHGKPNESDKAIWNDQDVKNNWKKVAEDTAKMVLPKNPNVLIMVEGTEIYPKNIASNGDYHSTSDADYYFNWWGGNLRGVADYPIDLGAYQNKLVYSPHDYGPSVYEQPWFKGGYDYASLYRDCWHDNWLYITENGTAPLLIGEWGGFMTQPNLTWMTYMRQLIGEYHLNHTFWCFNANSGDTGGLVLGDFITWDTEKYNFVKEVLWQENGKFVGLDHDIPLGTAGNGITLSEASGL